jgi:hypothetical protein
MGQKYFNDSYVLFDVRKCSQILSVVQAQVHILSSKNYGYVNIFEDTA